MFKSTKRAATGIELSQPTWQKTKDIVAIWGGFTAKSPNTMACLNNNNYTNKHYRVNRVKEGHVVCQSVSGSLPPCGTPTAILPPQRQLSYPAICVEELAVGLVAHNQYK